MVIAINVKTPSGKTITIKVKQDATIKNVKQSIKEVEGCRRKYQKLYVMQSKKAVEGTSKFHKLSIGASYKELENDMTLTHYDIKNGDMLRLTVEGVGGARAKVLKTGFSKLSDMQKVENLTNRFKKMHVTTVASEDLKQLIETLQQAEKTLVSLGKANYLQTVFEQMDLEQIKKIYEMLDTDKGMDRKLPAIIQATIPNITALADATGFVGQLAEKLLESGMVNFARTWNRVNDALDQA